MASIRGKERFRRILARLPQKQRDAIKPVLRQEANAIVATQKQLVPGDEGETRASINAKSGADNLADYMRLRGRAKTQDPEMAVVISAGNPVTGNTKRSDAHLLEFGTSSMAARPFFFPAWRAHKREAISRINRAVRKAIKDAIRTP